MADYAAKPTKAKEDISIIDLRKRMLTVFLNRCRKMKEVREDGVWWRFLDPNASWVSSYAGRTARDAMLIILNAGRGPTLPSGCLDTQKQYESSSLRPLEPYPGSPMATYTQLFCQAQITIKNILIRHAIIATS